jgi:hypothetical protein
VRKEHGFFAQRRGAEGVAKMGSKSARGNSTNVRIPGATQAMRGLKGRTQEEREKAREVQAGSGLEVSSMGPPQSATEGKLSTATVHSNGTATSTIVRSRVAKYFSKYVDMIFTLFSTGQSLGTLNITITYCRC